MNRDRYDDLAERPLFGETQPKGRVLNLILGVLTTLLVLESLAVSIYHYMKIMGILISFCIFLMCISHSILIYWYRQGDLEPKFRSLIYFNTMVLISMCICVNLFVFDITLH